MVDLIDASLLPGELDAVAVVIADDVEFVVRNDYSPQQVVDAINRLGREINRGAIDATYRRRTSAPE